MLGADEVVGPVGGDENRRRPARQPRAVVLEIAQAEQVAADRGRRQQAGEELDIGFVGLAERHIEGGAARARRGERRRHLARRDAALRHRAGGVEVLPRHQAKAVDIERRHRDHRARNPRPRHEPRRIEDGGAHGAGADGGALDEIRRQRRRTALQQRPRLPREVGVEQRLAHRVVIDVGLDVEDHLGAGDPAAGVDPGDDVERRRRVARRGDDIEGREDVGGDLAVLVGGNRRRRPLLRPELLGAGEHHRHHLGREALAQLALFGERRWRGEQRHREQRHRQQRSPRPPQGAHARMCAGKKAARRIAERTVHSLRFPSGMMAASKFAPSVCASVRIAFLRLAPSKVTPRRSAPWKLAPNRSTPANLEPRRSAP